MMVNPRRIANNCRSVQLGFMRFQTPSGWESFHINRYAIIFVYYEIAGGAALLLW
jgi:hypothetical protein